MIPITLFIYTDTTKVINLLLLTTNSRILCKFSIMGKTGCSLIEMYSHCTEFCAFSGLEFCVPFKCVGSADILWVTALGVLKCDSVVIVRISKQVL